MSRWSIAAAGMALLVALWWTVGWDTRAPERQVRRAAQLFALDTTEAGHELSRLLSAKLELTVESEPSRQLTALEVAAELGKLRRERGPVIVELRQVEVRTAGRSARAEALAIISQSQVGDLHATERPVWAELRRLDGWRLTRVTVGAARKRLPEARP